MNATEIAKLKQELEDAKDDLLRLEGACWYCLNPEIEPAWRHDHDGNGHFHWHHRIDPGDGLVNHCKHSELYERVWAEAQGEMRVWKMFKDWCSEVIDLMRPLDSPYLPKWAKRFVKRGGK